MAPSFPPELPEDPPAVEMGSWLMRFGSAVGAGGLGAILATAPATLRLEGDAGVCSPAGAWTLLIAVTLVPMSLLVHMLQRARSGFLALGPGGDKVRLAALLGWFGSTFATLGLLGALLRARTHHHALAGATFAMSGLVLSLLLALVWARLAAMGRRAGRAGGWALVVAVGIGAAIAFASAHPLASSFLLPAQSVKLVDGMAFALGAAVASGRPFVNRRALALVGPPLAAAVFLLGASSFRTCPSLREALPGQAPAVAWLVGLLGSN